MLRLVPTKKDSNRPLKQPGEVPPGALVRTLVHQGRCRVAPEFLVDPGAGGLGRAVGVAHEITKVNFRHQPLASFRRCGGDEPRSQRGELRAQTGRVDTHSCPWRPGMLRMSSLLPSTRAMRVNWRPRGSGSSASTRESDPRSGDAGGEGSARRRSRQLVSPRALRERHSDSARETGR